MPGPRGYRCSYSINARLEDRLVPPPELRTISAFQPAFSGMALAGRAFNQALKFGVEIAIPIQVVRLDCGDRKENATDTMKLELTNNVSVHARTVVIATGARYRRPAIPNLKTLEGRGVSYWASPVEAKLCEGEEVALVGGGNSAGQAVVFLAPKVKRL